jgi:hypothetical protein
MVGWEGTGAGPGAPIAKDTPHWPHQGAEERLVALQLGQVVFIARVVERRRQRLDGGIVLALPGRPGRSSNEARSKEAPSGDQPARLV